MHVEDDRSLLASVDAGQRAVNEGGREQPEESAAEGQVHAGAARGADRHLPEVDALDVLRDVREARPVGEAVAVVDDGVHGGVVGEALLDEHAERPRRVAPDRVVRRAVAAHEAARRLLHRVLGAPDVGAEARRSQPVDGRVVPAVAGDLVPALHDRADEARLALRHHAEREEGAARTVGVEQVEQALGLSRHAAGQALKTVDAEGGFELVAVVILLDVDGQCIDDRLRQPGPRASAARGAATTTRRRRPWSACFSRRR